MNKPLLNVAVTGLNNIDSPGPGVPVIRALKESDSFNVRIIGLAYENLEPGIYMDDLTNKTYLVPYPSEGTEILYNRIIQINEMEKLDVLIPNFDAELFAFMKAEKLLKDHGIRMFLPTIEQFEERQKSNLEAFGKKTGVNVPKGRTIITSQDIYSIKKDFEFPVMIKGKFYDAGIAYNEEQARMLYNKYSAKWGLPIIIQEFIKGTEVNVVALGDGKGETIAAVAMRKQYITDKGKAWGGITIRDEQLLQLTKSIISKTKWKGGMELELIRTNRNELYLIEINPRIPAWVYLAVGAGQNIPEALVQLAIGMQVKPFANYEIGKMFIRYSYDMICDINTFEKFSTTGEL